MEISEEIFVQINDEMDALVNRYKQAPVLELMKEFDLSVDSKNALYNLSKKLISSANPIVLSDLLQKNQIILKTIKLDKYGGLKESMSFPTFKYKHLVDENWMDSSLREIFKHFFVFVIYQAGKKQLYLKKIILWKMPEEVLDIDVHDVWEKTKQCILSGNIVKYIDKQGRYFTYFPSSSESPYIHVRPHAQNRNDTYDLPVADNVTGLVKYQKHCFWLNRSYLLKSIND